MRIAAATAAGLVLGGTLLAHATKHSHPLEALADDWSISLGVPSPDDFVKQVQDGGLAGLKRVRQALHDERRFLALLRMSSVVNDVTALAYLRQRSPEQRKDAAAFEAEWTRLGGVLKTSLETPSAASLADVRPAALRAIGEASLPQAGVFYDASVEYGRSTTADSGLYYLGAAKGQADFVSLVRALAGADAFRAPARLAAPAVRDVAGELEALQDDLLAAYRPPASVDRHREFIVASSTLKEARELQALGLRHGALLRYLQAAVRVAPLRAGAPAPDATVASKLEAFEPRLGGADHSIGRLLLEWAQADLAEHAADGQALIAAAIASDALPRYFAALEPERVRPDRPSPTVTVTLVRWPYT